MPADIVSPDAARRKRLLAGCRELSLPVSDEAADKLLCLIDLIARWNRVHNLTAVRDPDEMLTHHLLDCLAVVPSLAANSGVPSSLADVGSGAGLPGLILAITWPDTTVHLIEPAAKRAAFLRQAVGELSLSNVQVHSQRVQDLSREDLKPAPQLLTCRAYAALAQFVEHCVPLAGAGTTIAAMKGPKASDEIAELSRLFGDGPNASEHNQPVRAAISNIIRSDQVRMLPIAVPGLNADRYLVTISLPDAIAGAPANP